MSLHGDINFSWYAPLHNINIFWNIVNCICITNLLPSKCLHGLQRLDTLWQRWNEEATFRCIVSHRGHWHGFRRRGSWSRYNCIRNPSISRKSKRESKKPACSWAHASATRRRLPSQPRRPLKFKQNLQRRGTSDTSFVFTFPQMQLICFSQNNNSCNLHFGVPPCEEEPGGRDGLSLLQTRFG